MKVAAMKKGYQHVSETEDKMEFEQSSTISGDRPVKPCPHLHTANVARNVSQTGDHGMSEPLTPLVDVEDNANKAVATKGRKEKTAKPQALYDKTTLCKHVKTWVNIVDASSMRSSSVSTSLHTSTPPPLSSSTVTTSNSGIEASIPHFDPQLLADAYDPNDPYWQFKSQLPEDWKWPAHQPRIPENEGSQTDKPVGPIVVDLCTLENSQCATMMSKDCKADNTVTGLANAKRKAAKLEYISSSEVELDNGTYDDCNYIDNATHVPEHKGVVKSSITVMKTMPKKVKIEAYDSLLTLSATSASKGSHVANDSSSQMEAISVQTCFNNTDLPSGLHKDQKWRREVVPTLILWAGNQDDAFNITKQDVCYALQDICQLYTPHLRTLPVPFFQTHPWSLWQVSQHLCNWRHGFASAAVAQLATFFLNPYDPSPGATMQLLLNHFMFLYEDLDATSPKKAFHSVFVQQLLLGSHLSATKGYVQVPTLDTSSLAKHGVIGALGLCGAALMHGLCKSH
ncbi:hypothetical protein F5141DRAFT_1220042 [Pisolithus sp. B1]|nr:hypothetical protein F5141DRAFT_1220042 [Pisolithus sp. B1]